MNEMKKTIEWLLNDSGITNYQISKRTGISQQVLHRYSTGAADVEKMSFGNAIKLYENYKEEIEMENNINGIIKRVENGELHTDTDFTTHEKDYTDGASDHFIQHEVDGVEIDGGRVYVLYAEKEHIKDLRQAVYNDEKTQEELEETLHELNGLDDQYNYDDVVAYDLESGSGIVWL